MDITEWLCIMLSRRGWRKVHVSVQAWQAPSPTPLICPLTGSPVHETGQSLSERDDEPGSWCVVPATSNKLPCFPALLSLPTLLRLESWWFQTQMLFGYSMPESVGRWVGRKSTIQVLPEPSQRVQRDREAWLEMREQSSIRRAQERRMDASPLTQKQQPGQQPSPTPPIAAAALLTGRGVQTHAGLSTV